VLIMDNHTPQSKLLVTGAGGALGSALLGQLRQDGWWIRALVLPGTAPLAMAHETVEADLCQADSLPRCLVGITHVLHMAGLILCNSAEQLFAVNREGTHHLVDSCMQAGIQRFVYVSSISVEYAHRNPYAESKWQAEQVVRASPLHWTIVRPTLLVGLGGGAEYRMFARLARWPVLALPAGGRARKRPVHVDDLAAGLCALLRAGAKTKGQCYALAGAEEHSLREMIASLAQEQGYRTPTILVLPRLICHGAALLLDYLPGRTFSARQALMGFLDDAVPSITAAQQDFAYAPVPLAGRWLK
jgi:uncharacterized protein YbjT (DUF2867 family)